MSLSDSLLENAVQKVLDDSLRENASNASGAGLEVRVTRTYDGIGLSSGRECKWCLDRCGENMTLNEAYNKGAFQRHPGCGCVIEYTSNKGVKTIQTGKYSGWNFADELEKRKTVGLDEPLYADELISRVSPYIDTDAGTLMQEALNGGAYSKTYERAAAMTKPELEKDIRGYLKATELHEWKIQHPEIYMERENPSDPILRQFAINHWKNDRRRNARITRILIEVWRSKYGT